MQNWNMSSFNKRRQPSSLDFGALISFLLAALLLGLTAAPVFAHEVEIQDAMPAPGAVLDESPPVVTIIFTEELVDGESSFQVLDRDGNAVDDGDAALDLNDPEHATLVAHISRPLPDGVYTVHYRVKVLDGDVTENEYRFALGDKYAGQALATPASAEQAGLTPAPTSQSQAQASAPSQRWSSALIITAIILIIIVLVAVFVARRRSTPSDSDHA